MKVPTHPTHATHTRCDAALLELTLSGYVYLQTYLEACEDQPHALVALLFHLLACVLPVGG
jgi:hypothetical protein